MSASDRLFGLGVGLAQRAMWVANKVARQVTLRRLRRTDVYAWRAEMARWEGVRVGKNPRIFENVTFMTEPYLVTLGDNIIVANNVVFMTHDAAPLMYRDVPPTEIYSRTTVGNDVFIGHGSIIMPNTTIGDRVLIGVNTVVRGRIPSDSVVMGNPGVVVMKLEFHKRLAIASKDALPAANGQPRVDTAEMCFRHFGLDPNDFDATFHLRDELARRLADRPTTAPVSQKRAAAPVAQPTEATPTASKPESDAITPGGANVTPVSRQGDGG